MDWLTDIILPGALALVFIAVTAMGIYLLRARLARAREEEEKLAQEFEAAALKDFAADGTSSALPGPPAAAGGGGVDVATPEVPVPAPAPDPDPVPAPVVDAPPANVEELAARLQRLGILEAREGQVPLSAGDAAPIYRMRQGGLALLLPQLESEAALVRFAQRFDLVFSLTASGQVLAVERFQGRIQPLLDAPTSR